MRRAKLWFLTGMLAALAALGGAMAADPPKADLHHATKAIADDIKSQRHAQGLDDQAKPNKTLGSQKTVRFRMPMKNGKGRDQADAYCFGYTLKCVARVKGPANTYSGQVSSSEGSQVRFKGKKAGDPLELTLDTAFLGDTTFAVVMEAGDTPWPEEAVVELVCKY